MIGNDPDPAVNSNPQSDDLPGILARPSGQLRSLPLRYRWETTRRHPYYLLTWRSVREEQAGGDPVASMLEQAHRTILGMIGVSAPAVDPRTSFETLVSQTTGPSPAWLANSVQPLSLRGIAGLLLAHLSSDTRRQLAELLLFSVDGGEGHEESLIQALLRLQGLNGTDLDMFADQPIVAISPTLTVNALTTDLRIFLDDYRNRHQITEQRVRLDKFEQYFAVWDARERWTGSGYELGDDRSLVDVAHQLSISCSTARNQYRAAFELITGHPYSTAKWLRIFGTIKFPADVMSDVNGAITRRRMQPRGSRPPVPESVLTSSHDKDGIATRSPSADNHEIAIWELIEDVRELSRSGRTDSEIAQELEIPLAAIHTLRERYEVE